MTQLLLLQIVGVFSVVVFVGALGVAVWDLARRERAEWEEDNDNGR